MTKTLTRCACIFIFLLSFQHSFSQVDTTIDKVFTQVEVEASFPGGDAAWSKYLGKEMNSANFDNFKNSDQGTCRLRFIVSKTGYVSNVQAITMKKSRLAKLAIAIIEASPRWNPAMQNGKAVNAYREQPLTFHFDKEKK